MQSSDQNLQLNMLSEISQIQKDNSVSYLALRVKIIYGYKKIVCVCEVKVEKKYHKRELKNL